MVSVINFAGGGPTGVLMSLQDGDLVAGSLKECLQGVLRMYLVWPHTCRVRVN